ncbi:MAG: U32 family peptidase [Spirochaetes bacterium]|nr:U32 family peptidase [Spirochaetota bacterium]
MIQPDSRIPRSEVELLAPVGSLECLEAAIQGGADAIYFGVGELNMRAKSSRNFTPADIAGITARCHEAGLRAYLTLNTVMYDGDLPALHAAADAAQAGGIDAVIASDLAALQYCRSIGLPVHISTQQNISNIEAVRFFAPWADVLVLARELNLEQVAAIAEAIRAEDLRGPSGRPLQLEMFAHGALCMATSGKCYLSLHEYNLSANRGSCVQICRRRYEVRDRETDAELAVDHEYIMSPKDLCTVHFLNKLLDAGVRVLKIEGRARPAEYVKTVCTVYNEALRSIEAGAYPADAADGSPVLQGWRERLATVFNRGFWDGYYLGQRLGEWSAAYGSEATVIKVYAGKVTNYYARSGIVEVYIENESVSAGDSCLFSGPTTGIHEFALADPVIDEAPVTRAERGQTVTFHTDARIRRSDKLYKLIPRQN